MHEATKTRNLWTDRELQILRGTGIDIGCGKDPVIPGVRPFEKEHGDANAITRYVKEQFDFVFSAHCLEHMKNPPAALLEWWQLVRPGGHLFFIVPDEDLYEQGMWPPIFNRDHKATFTLSKKTSWSKCSHNVLDLIDSLPGSELVDVRVHDEHLDRTYLKHRPCPRWWARMLARLRTKAILFWRARGLELELKWFAPLFRVPIDQTLGKASAQIQAIVRKSAGAG